MNNNSKTFALLLLMLCALSCLQTGCTKTDDNENRSTSNSGVSGGEKLLSTFCGVPNDGALNNPISSTDGTLVQILGLGATPGTIIILREEGAQLVKLRAVSEEASESETRRASSITSAFGSQAYLYSDECPFVTKDGALATVGDLVNPLGDSLAESLFASRAAGVNGEGECGESLVATCYQSLLDTSDADFDEPEMNTPESNLPGTNTPTPDTGGNISNFLWKPRAERDGNLVVLLNPYGATVIVNEETILVGSGPSNGRGTTARANKPGGAFGTNIKVEVFDEAGRTLVFPNGELFYIIPNGASRVEF